MATLASTTSTLADFASRLDPDGKIAKIGEVLNEMNEVLNDMQFMEANSATGHKLTIRTGLPEATWRKLNYGVARAKSRTAQVTDTFGMLEVYSVVDEALAKLSGNVQDFRFSEDIAFIEGMNQQMADNLFYADSTTYPERFQGLSNRYNDTGAASGANIIDGGGTGATNTSIWLVLWGPQTAYGIFPKGSKAGLQFKDKGIETVLDADSNEYEAYRSHYKWDLGVCVKDWRYIVRIANVDVNQLTADASGNSSDLIDLMVQATELIRNPSIGKGAFYCNQTIRSYLRRQMREAGKYNLDWSNIEGKRVLMFDEYPVRRTDALLSTESAVS